MTEQLAAGSIFHNLVGRSQCMIRLFDTVRKLSAVKSNVLILGESGTGKELFSRAIHYNGITRDARLSRSTAGRFPLTWWSRSCLGSPGAPSPVPTRHDWLL